MLSLPTVFLKMITTFVLECNLDSFDITPRRSLQSVNHYRRNMLRETIQRSACVPQVFGPKSMLAALWLQFRWKTAFHSSQIYHRNCLVKLSESPVSRSTVVSDHPPGRELEIGKVAFSPLQSMTCSFLAFQFIICSRWKKPVLGFGVIHKSYTLATKLWRFLVQCNVYPNVDPVYSPSIWKTRGSPVLFFNR